jgi:hypothetical protein
MSLAFTRQLTVTASTKRPPTLSSGKRGAPAAYLTTLKCMPIDHTSRDTQNTFQLETPINYRQTMTLDTYDIKPGDVLTVSGVDYPIVYVQRWPAMPGRNDAYKLLVLTERVTV